MEWRARKNAAASSLMPENAAAVRRSPGELPFPGLCAFTKDPVTQNTNSLFGRGGGGAADVGAFSRHGVETQLAEASRESGAAICIEAPNFARTVWIWVLVFSAVAAGLQIYGRAYEAELSSYPDEAAHAVTGMAFRQYVLHGLAGNPIDFFRNYYLHYPKVAIGHWPPLLYVVEAAAMLVASASKYSLLGLEALLTGILAWLVFRELVPLVGRLPAALGAVTLLFNRQIRTYASMTMTEILSTVTMFLACLAFARFADKRRKRDAVWFGIWTAAAILTKGSGWALLPIAALVVVVLAEWRLPLDRRLLPSAFIVGILCVPWQIATMASALRGFESPSPNLAFTIRAMGGYLRSLLTMPGIPLAVVALAGAAWILLGRNRLGHPAAYWAALMSLIAGEWLFNVVVPTSIEQRKVIMMLPAVFVMAAAGARLVAQRTFRRRQGTAASAVFASLCLLTLAQSFPIQAKQQLGFTPVAARLDRLLPPGSAALVVSDSLGEGALISEMAFQRPLPRAYLVRGSKLLASQEWNGAHYRDRVESAEECARLLASIPIGVLVIDRRDSVFRQAHFDVVENMLRVQRDGWRLMDEFPSPAGSPHAIALYIHEGPIEPVRNLPAWITPQSVDSENRTFE